MWIKKYKGISYPPILGWRPIRWLWKRLCCPRDWHQFDEVLSYGGKEEGPDHYLVCDACGLCVEIKRIMTEEESCRVCH